MYASLLVNLPPWITRLPAPSAPPWNLNVIGYLGSAFAAVFNDLILDVNSSCVSFWLNAGSSILNSETGFA